MPTPCLVVDRRGIAPRFPPCDDGVFLLDQQPFFERSGRESNPVFRAYQGGVRPQHFQTIELRRPDLNRRGTAYETVLEPGSSPLRSQYPRQDSNLR